MTRLSDRRTIEGKFRQYLATAEPKLQRALSKVWKTQRDSITVSDLRYATANGKAPKRLLSSWHDAYARFVNTKMEDYWRDSAGESKGNVRDDLLRIGVGAGTDDDYLRAMDDWVKNRGGAMITALSDSQRQAVNKMLRWHSINEPLGPRELAKRIENVVPLTPRQELAVRNLRDKLIAKGVTGAALDRAVGAYALKQQRLRSTRIARTELATAYNAGGVQSIRSAIADGDLDAGATKEWMTSEDERVCAICGPMDEPPGNVVPISEPFTSGAFSADHPPIHPQCRCTLLYDVEPGTGEKSLQLTDDERRNHVEDSYGPGTDPEIAPDGKPFDEDEYGKAWNTINELEPARPFDPEEYADEQRYRDAQSDIRKNLARLQSEYGIANNDVARQLPMAGVVSVEDIDWAVATHNQRNGRIAVDGNKLVQYNQRFIRQSHADRNKHDLYNARGRTGMSALLHEANHGAGPRLDGIENSELEEFTTEMSARWMVKDKFKLDGVSAWTPKQRILDWRKSGKLDDMSGISVGYAGLVGNTRSAFVRSMRRQGFDMSNDRAANILGRASVLFKRDWRAGTFPGSRDREAWDLFMDKMEIPDGARDEVSRSMRDALLRGTDPQKVKLVEDD